MRKLIYILALLIAGISARAQETPPAALKPVNGQFYINLVDSSIWHQKGAPYGWERLARYKDLASVTPIITGGAFTSSNTGIGFNPGSGITIQSFINSVWYGSQPPTVSLTGGSVREFTSSSTESLTLSYSYGKQAGTQNIASATIAGSTSGVTQNANGASGSYPITVTANVTNSYTLTATTIDSKSASSTTSVSYAPRRYFGYSAGPIPTNTEILAAAGGGSSLTSSKAGTFTITPSGSKYPFVAYVSTSGTLTSLSIGGAPYVWNLNVISVNNGVGTGGGYIANYNVYVDPSPTSGSLTIVTN